MQEPPIIEPPLPARIVALLGQNQKTPSQVKFIMRVVIPPLSQKENTEAETWIRWQIEVDKEKHRIDMLARGHLMQEEARNRLDWLQTQKPLVNVTVGEMCYESHPCQHALTFEYEDGTQMTKLLGARDIIVVLKNIGRDVDPHFSHYLE